MTVHEHAVEVDTKLAELHGRLVEVNQRLDSNKLSLAHALGIRPSYVTRTRREVTQTADELVEMLSAKLPGLMPWQQRDAERDLARRDEYLAQRQTILAEMKPLDEDFDRQPWSRFFLLVSSAGGHIHARTSCSTTRITSGFNWLPTLSGLTEKDAVDAHGPLLCSVCFPSAPVEWTVGVEKPVDPDRCPGSGTRDHDSSGIRYYSPRAKCNHCQETVSVTSTGKLRAHKAVKS